MSRRPGEVAGESGIGMNETERNLKIAILHDGLGTMGGSERVLEQFLQMFPGADLLVTFDFLDQKDRAFLGDRRIVTSFIQHLPGARKHYRSYFPLIPLAVEQFDLKPYDVVISSSHSYIKGVITGPDQLHICYCHSPVRYAWDMQPQYLAEARLSRGLKGVMARLALHYIRLWDSRTANGVDQFIANSCYIARRIRKVYGRESTVIYPPVDVDYFQLGTGKEDYYIALSRLVPYKRTELLLDAFRSMPSRRLVVIGSGTLLDLYRKEAPPNVIMKGNLSRDEVRIHLQRAKALIFAAEEDFGIVPVEAQACGTPVIAYRRGGAGETVVDGRTGVLFGEQTKHALRSAVEKFESMSFNPTHIRENALRFSAARFRREATAAIQEWMMKADASAARPPLT